MRAPMNGRGVGLAATTAISNARPTAMSRHARPRWQRSLRAGEGARRHDESAAPGKTAPDESALAAFTFVCVAGFLPRLDDRGRARSCSQCGAFARQAHNLSWFALIPSAMSPLPLLLGPSFKPFRIGVVEQQWKDVLIHRCHYEFRDEFANLHLPKRCLQR